jgi:hypothetical protein
MIPGFYRTLLFGQVRFILETVLRWAGQAQVSSRKGNQKQLGNDKKQTSANL